VTDVERLAALATVIAEQALSISRLVQALAERDALIAELRPKEGS